MRMCTWSECLLEDYADIVELQLSSYKKQTTLLEARTFYEQKNLCHFVFVVMEVMF